MSIFQGRTGNRQMKEECIRAWDCLHKSSGLSLNTDSIKKAYKIMIQDKNGVLAGKYRKSPVFLRYRIFPPADTIERLVDDAIYRYYHPSDPTIEPIFDLINIHPLEASI